MPSNFTVEANGVYRSGDLVMVPGGNERTLAHLYFQFEAEGITEVLFYEGAKPTLKWFLDEYMGVERSTLLCYRQTPNGPYNGLTPLGMGWINKSQKIGKNFSRAETAMSFVKHVPADDTLALAYLMTHWAFSNLPIDTLVGVTPYPNKAARLFGQRLGFQQTTPLEGYSCWHGKLCSVILQSMTRSRWQGIISQPESEVA